MGFELHQNYQLPYLRFSHWVLKRVKIMYYSYLYDQKLWRIWSSLRCYQENIASSCRELRIHPATTQNVASIFRKEILTQWGVPDFILSDGREGFRELCENKHFTPKLTTAYHPQTNLTERVNRTLKTMMAANVDNNHRTWDQFLLVFWKRNKKWKITVLSCWSILAAMETRSLVFGL